MTVADSSRGWTVALVLLIAAYTFNGAWYLRSRNRPISPLKRQQFQTAFWGGAFAIAVVGLLLILHSYS